MSDGSRSRSAPSSRFGVDDLRRPDQTTQSWQCSRAQHLVRPRASAAPAVRPWAADPERVLYQVWDMDVSLACAKDSRGGAAELTLHKGRRGHEGRFPAGASYAPGVAVAALAETLFPDAVSLWHEVGLTRPWNDPGADLTRAMSGPASTVLATCDGEGRLVGTVMVGHDGHRAWVYYLAVRPDRQRTGAGRELMDAAEAWARSRGIPKIQLMVRRGNEEATGFYRGLGYEDADVVVLARWLV
jgi:ribosomal protein S18 acetylase RimI-like enzyme